MIWPIFARFVGGGLVAAAIGWVISGRFGPGGLLVVGLAVLLGSFAGASRRSTR